MTFNIKLNQLRAYQSIMLTGSVTAAAERLHTTQPAVSRQLSSLEQATRLRLFERRSGGRMIPTALGLRFFRHIEGTLSGIEDLPDVAKLLREDGQVRLRIGATPPLLNGAFFAAALKDFTRRLPDIRLNIESRARLDIEEWVANGQIDVGLALLPTDSPLVQAASLMTTAAIAVVHRDHPLAGRRALSPALVRNHRIILPSRQLLRALIDKSLAESGLAIAPAIETSSALTGCKLAAEGMGVAICDPFSPTAFEKVGLKVIRWKPDVPLTYGYITAKQREMSFPAKLFCECLAEQARHPLAQL